MYQKGFRSQMRVVAITATGALALALCASSASADTAKCQQAISKSTAKYELAVQKALGKCQDAHAKDATKTPSCPDTKAAGKISKALTKLGGSISKACTGETVDGLGFGGLIHECSSGERVGLSCVKDSDCNGSCDSGGQIGEPCTSNNPDPSHGGTGNCAGACTMSGMAIADDGTLTDQVNGPFVSCKGNGAAQCQARKSCSGNAGHVCTTDPDCAPSDGTCTVSGVCGAGAFVGHCAGFGTCNPADGCPNLINGHAPFSDCAGPLATLDDLTTCIACNSSSNAHAVTDLAYIGRRAPFGDPAFGLPDDGDKGKSVLACQREIGKAAGKYFQKVRKATQKCTASLQKAKVMSCPDSKLSTTITSAQADLLAAINGKCGGTLFNETVVQADSSKSLLDSEPLADAMSPLPTSNASFTALAEGVLGTLITCSDDFGAGLPAMGLPPCPQLASNCGNGSIDAGEDCDDGNVVNGDTCPSDCHNPSACSVTGTVNVAFNVTSPVNPLGALTGYLTYDNTKVNIPGTGNGAGPNVSAGAFSQSVNDLDYAIRVVLADPGDIGAPPFTVTFNVCSGAPVTAADFGCLVEQAGDPATGSNVAGVTCSVSVM